MEKRKSSGFRLTDVGANPSEDMPPAMQLKHERPRHTDAALPCGQG